MQYQQAMLSRRATPVFHANVTDRPARTVAMGYKPSMTIPRRALSLPVKVSTADIVKRLGLATLTVVKWRQGSSQRPALPSYTTVIGKHNRVHFLEHELMAWLKVYRPDLLDMWRG